MDLGKIVAVIVLYRSSLEKSESFQTLLGAVQKFESELSLIVYNNSPQFWQNDDKTYHGLKIMYIEDPLNSGVSKAYNYAFTYAKNRGQDYILLLDQDTSLSASFFKAFFDAENQYKNSDTGLYCPRVMSSNELMSPAEFIMFASRKKQQITSGKHPLKGLAIINGGLIISTKLFGLVGGYNEKIKLDFSDYDFLKRSLKFTNKIVVLDTSCQHLLSSEHEMSVDTAMNRFDYYLEGAINYNKSFITSAGLAVWVFLRAVKLNLRYNTIDFTNKVIYRVLKKA